MDETKKEKVVAVAGPTASGKTALAVRLAEKFSGEVVSCDSMQLYRGMDIGTAKITAEEAHGIPHHLTDVFDISESFSVSDYVNLAESAVSDILSRNKLPIFCGGTGLYLDSFLSGLDFGEYDNLPGLREELAAVADEEDGREKLHGILRDIDPVAAEEIHPANVKRVIRAIEIYRSSGITPTEQKRRSLLKGSRYSALVIVLGFADRQKLYDRIDARVDRMIESGLLNEAKRLIGEGLLTSPTAGAAIGYKEFIPYFGGEATLEECTEVLKRESRRYAKRQMTWFSRRKDALRLNVDEYETSDALFAQAHGAVKRFLEDGFHGGEMHT